jgi:hypothetical protein
MVRKCSKCVKSLSTNFLDFSSHKKQILRGLVFYALYALRHREGYMEINAIISMAAMVFIIEIIGASWWRW